MKSNASLMLKQSYVQIKFYFSPASTPILKARAVSCGKYHVLPGNILTRVLLITRINVLVSRGCEEGERAEEECLTAPVTHHDLG